jgi:AcrR family transcriptional regulator
MNELIKMPRTKKGVETLNNILSAATQLFYEKGYYGANIADITQLAGVATGTFYVYFDSKFNLYCYLLLQFSHTIRKELVLKIGACRNRRDAERNGIKAWLEFVIGHPYVYNIIWESLYVDRRLFVDYYENFSRSYMRGLDAAKLKGEVRDIDSEVLSYTLMGVSNFLGLKYGLFRGEGSPDLDYVTDEIMKVLDGGMFITDAPPVPEPRAERRANLDFHVEVDMDFLGGDDRDEKEEKEGDDSCPAPVKK